MPPLVKFLLIDAVWDGASRADCLPRPERPEVGACWAFVIDRINFFTYGFYPIEERWRVDVFFALLAIGVVWMAWLDAPRRDLGVIYFFVVMPIASLILLLGWPLIGLPKCADHVMGRRAGDRRGGGGRHRLLAAASASCWRSAAARACRRCGCSR